MKMDNDRSAAVIAEWPKRLPLTVLDKVCIVLTLVVMLAPVVHLLINYAGLPAEIATEYQGGAVVETEREAKWFLLILAFGDLLCTLSVLVCIFFPRAINIPPLLLKRPAEQIIRGTRLYLYFTSIACAVFFGYMLEVFLRCAKGTPTEMSGWAIVGLLVAIFGSMGIYFLWLWRGDAAHAPKGKAKSAVAAQRSAVMEKWPEKLPLSLADKLMIGVSALLVLLTLARLAMVYGELPATIPTHFGFNGEVDGHGRKSSLLVIAGCELLVWAVIVVNNILPQTINVPVFLMKRPAEEIVRGTRVLLNTMAVVICGFFWYIQEITVAIALGAGTAGLHPAALIVFMVGLFGAMIAYFIWLWRA